MSDGPRYEHPCDLGCIFLARSGDYDLWWHPGTTRSYDNVIARHGHAQPDYKIGLSQVGFDPQLTEAFDRACAEGLVPPAIQKRHAEVADMQRAAKQ